MAGNLYITEFADAAFLNGKIPVGMEPGVDQSPLAFTTHAESAALGSSTKLVRLNTDAVCSVAFGPAATVTATTSNRRMAANQTEYFGVPPTSGYKISVVSNT